MSNDHAVVQKVLRRLIPFCVLCYLLNYIDRVNISIASLKMVESAGPSGIKNFTEIVYSNGAGIFFLGYCLFELPSNLIQERVGPRRWIARIMISWGLLSMCFMFVNGPWSFYTLRFLLGAAEAGFFPGMILYLSYWIPHQYRARAAALFLTSTAISGVIGNPLGGFILYATEAKPFGLWNWQWLFLIEGLPSILLGLVTLFFLTDHPKDAQWLTVSERESLSAILAREQKEHPGHDKAALIDALKSRHMWVLSAFYGLMIFAFYMVNFYTPRIIEKSLRASNALSPETPKLMVDLYVCLLAAIPFGAAAIGMVLIGRHSDKTNERKLHLAFTCALVLVGMTLAGVAPWIASGSFGTLLTIGGLSIGAIGAFGMFGPFWALPPQFLTGTAAAAAFAIINSIGNFFGGFGGPKLSTHLTQEQTLLVAAGLGGLAMILALLAPIPRHGSLQKVAAVEGKAEVVT